MNNISRIPPLARDEIDLFIMLQSIWRQKHLIAAFMLLIGCLAAIYAFLVTPQYEVNTVLRPTALNELDALNRSEVYSLPPGEALSRVGAALESYDTRLGYFRSNPQLMATFGQQGRTPEQAFEVFNRDALRLVLPDPKKANHLSAFIGLSMRYPQGLDGDEILNGFVQYALDKERLQIDNDLKIIISNRLNEIDAKLRAARASHDATKEGQIAVLIEADNLKRLTLKDELRAIRVQLKVRRDDRIAQLDEAIGIAHSLGLKRPSTPSSMGNEADAAGHVIRTEVTNQQIPLYFLGTDALQAERRALRARTSDDFVDARIAQIRKEMILLNNNRKVQVLRQRESEEVFLKGVEALRAERARLEHLSIDMSQLRIVNIDRLAVEPSGPIEPRKGFIIGSGLLVGCLMGVLLAALRYLLVARRHHRLQAHTAQSSQVIDGESRSVATTG